MNTHFGNPGFANFSLCRGLCGFGEIYLDAYKILGHKYWLNRASRIANTMFHLQKAI